MRKGISPTTSTLIGTTSVLMWSASLGLFRSISEIFGPTGGPALIFTMSGLFASFALGLPDPRQLPRIYLLGGGALFIAYEVSLALSIGLAHNRGQALELGMINYLWPSLTVLFAVLIGQQRASWPLVPAVGLCFGGIIWVMKGDGHWSALLLWENIESNPVAYMLALGAAFVWATYSSITRLFGSGKNAVPLFLLATAIFLWVKYTLSSEPSLTMNVSGLEQVILLGVLTAAAYSCWNHGIQHGNITLLATASYFTPILSALLASLWLGVRPGTSFFYGVLMVTTGSLICWWATRTQH
jgi:drug/metabolite transporter (DMT)-like permease